MMEYLKKFLDSTDKSADCLAAGILLGFCGFNAMFAVVTFVFAASAFGYAHFNAPATAAMMASMGGTYAAVLSATTAAYRWRNGNGTTTSGPDSKP